MRRRRNPARNESWMDRSPPDPMPWIERGLGRSGAEPGADPPSRRDFLHAARRLPQTAADRATTCGSAPERLRPCRRVLTLVASVDESSRTLTMLLRAWRQGDQAAFEEVAPLIYEELRRIAA